MNDIQSLAVELLGWFLIALALYAYEGPMAALFAVGASLIFINEKLWIGIENTLRLKTVQHGLNRLK